MKLSKSQVNHFKEKGYLAVDSFFESSEVMALQRDIKRLQDIRYLRNVTTDGDGQSTSTTAENLQLRPARFHSSLIRSLPFAPKVLEAITSLIGDQVILHGDQIFLKPARVGKGTNWHQDNAYFKIKRPTNGTAMWIAIHDATVENGTIRVLPYAFAETLAHQRDPYSDHHIRCAVDEAEAETVELNAGGVLFFCYGYGTPHATGDNPTGSDRAGLAYHFLNVEEIDDTFRAKKRTRREPQPLLTGPRASGKE